MFEFPHGLFHPGVFPSLSRWLVVSLCLFAARFTHSFDPIPGTNIDPALGARLESNDSSHEIDMSWGLSPSMTVPLTASRSRSRENRVLLDGLASGTKYLIYSPQFGMYNQVRALFHAIGIAKALKRVLVAPDVVANNGRGPVFSREVLFDSNFLLSQAGGVIISTSQYKALLSSGQAQLPNKIIELQLPIKQLSPNNLYFEHLGIGSLPHENAVGLTSFSEKSWLSWASKDAENIQKDSTIAFYCTYMAWMDLKFQGKAWLDGLEKAVFQEAPWITTLVDKATRTGTPSGMSKGYICMHARRGDFKASCDAYDLEMTTAKPRSFVVANFKRNLACWVDEDVVLNQVRLLKAKMLEKYGSMVPIYLSTNDAIFSTKTRQVLARDGIRLHTLDDLVSLPSSAHAAYPVIDVAMCSNAQTLVLNQFSTFSRAIYKVAQWKNSEFNASQSAFAWGLNNGAPEMPMYLDGTYKR